MVLIFGLLRQQSGHVCRWLLYIVGSILISLLLFVVAAILHKATDVWLHQVHINRRETPIPDLMLLSFPLGLCIGQLFAWIGTWRDQATGHAKAEHWSWWCVPSSVALLLTLGISMILNDWVLRARRDAIFARARALTKQLDLLSPPPQELPPLLQKIDATPTFLPPTYFAWDEFSENPEWPANAQNALEMAAQAIETGGYESLQKLTTERIVRIAELFVARSKYRLNGDAINRAADDLMIATKVIDQGIGPGSHGSAGLIGFELERQRAIEYLVNKNLVAGVTAKQALRLEQLITKRPYTNLKPPPAGRWFSERDKIRTCLFGLQPFTANRRKEASEFVSFWGRFLGMRHGLAAAESQLNFTLPPPPTDTSIYNSSQLRRIVSNALVRGAVASAREGRLPEQKEIFGNDFTNSELKKFAFMQFGDSCSLWVKSQPDDLEVARTLQEGELFPFFRRRDAVFIGPYHRTWHKTLNYQYQVGKYRNGFEVLLDYNQSPESVFVATLPHMELLSEPSLGGEADFHHADAMLCVALQDKNAHLLKLGDKWVEIGFCLIENPYTTNTQIGLCMSLPIHDIGQRKEFIAQMSNLERRKATEALADLTTDELRTRYEAILPGLKDYLRRPVHSFDEVQLAVDQLRDFYTFAEMNDLTIFFCPDGPLRESGSGSQ